MTERQDEENKPDAQPASGNESEPDLREVMSDRSRHRKLPLEQRYSEPDPPPMKLPPVWPGDEKQEWFRKERGLPPMPDRDAAPPVEPEDLPTPLADIPTRARAFGLVTVIPTAISMIIPVLGYIITIPLGLTNLFLYRQGQDVGCVVFKMRVLRENGDVAGFFQMWVRSAAAIISLLALGAGYWTAFSDPHFRTWHDKWLHTYVVKDAEEYKTAPRSSSAHAKNWFWITLLLVLALSLMLALGSAPTPEATPTQ